MTQNILNFVINIYQDITNLTLQCCVVKVEKVLINVIKDAYVKQLPKSINFFKIFNYQKCISVCLHERFNSSLF
jgi:hypothetical protein